VVTEDYLYYLSVDHCVQYSQLFQHGFLFFALFFSEGLHEMQGCLARNSKPALSFLSGVQGSGLTQMEPGTEGRPARQYISKNQALQTFIPLT
jgi:hypothetical protein